MCEKRTVKCGQIDNWSWWAVAYMDGIYPNSQSNLHADSECCPSDCSLQLCPSQDLNEA